MTTNSTRYDSHTSDLGVCCGPGSAAQCDCPCHAWASGLRPVLQFRELVPPVATSCGVCETTATHGTQADLDTWWRRHDHSR